MRDTKKIEEIVRALIAKANATDNADEAAAFMAKAHEMLEKYQLDLGTTLNADDPIEHFDGLDLASTSHKWNRELYRALGALYGCKTFRNVYYAKDANGNIKYNRKGEPDLRFTMILTGRASAIMTVQLMYPWVCEQVRIHAKAISVLTGMSEQGQAKRVGAALVSRIWGMIAEEQRATGAKPPAVVKNMLVTVDLVEAAFNARHPNQSIAASRATRSDSLSRQAAGKIGLNQQVGGAGVLRLK